MNTIFYFRQLTILFFFCTSVNQFLNATDYYSPTHDFSSYTELICEFIPIPSRSTKAYSHTNIPGPLETFYKSARSLVQSSTNWAGYVGVSNLAQPARNSINTVTGSWIAPTITSSLTDTYSALWIGIDGFSNGTVEQIGTAHDCINGIVHHYAWFEMYPNKSFAINGFPVQTGDSLSASIVYTQNGIFIMTIYNNTRHTYVTIPTSYTTALNAQRSSAEWIVEAPYLKAVLPLSHFDTVHFTNCSATVHGVSTPLGALPVIELIMTDRQGNLKAIPSALFADKKSFTVTWKHQ
jgi:hypothetical protein